MQTQTQSPGTTTIVSQVQASGSQANSTSGYGATRRNSYSSILAANMLSRAGGGVSTGNTTPLSSRTGAGGGVAGGGGGGGGGGGSKATSALGTHDETGTNAPKESRESVSGSHQASLKLGPRLRAEGLMAPPASDAATLRRQVAALQLDLEGHVESEKRLQGVNQQLRERLELYMQQNHENVERAENELNTLHEDMEQTLDLQRRLAQRATSLEKEKKELEQALQKCLQEFDSERSALQSRITKLNEELREKSNSKARARAIQAELELALVAKKQLEEELNASTVETDYLKHKAEEYSCELQKLIIKRQKEALVEKSSRKNLLRRSFHNFKEAIEEQQLFCYYDNVASEFARSRRCKRGLRALRLATKRSAKIRQAYERQANSGLEECWRGWRLATIAQKRFETAVRRKKQLCLCKTVTNWRAILEMGKLSGEEEHQFTNAATTHWRRFTSQQYLKRWYCWVRKSAKPMKMKMQEFQAHVNRLIIQQSLFAWTSLVRTNRIKMLKKVQADRQGQLGCKRRTLTRWLNFLDDRRIHLGRNENAFRFRNAHKQKFTVNCWYAFVEMQKQKRFSKALAFRHYLHVAVSKGFKAWKQSVKLQQAEHMAFQEINQALKRASMLFWREYLVAHAVKKKKEMKALVFKKRRDKKIARELLIFWWEEMAWRRRASQLSRLLSSRRHRTLLVDSLHGWIHATFDNLLVANAKFHSELSEVKAQCEDQKQQTTAVDVENLQLIDRLHAMSSEVALLKITIAEKEKQEEELRHALEDGAVIEGSLQGDLEQQIMRIEELELDVLNLQKKLQLKNLEDTAGEVHHTMEIQNLERTLKDFQTQLAVKSSQLVSYEKALKDTAEKLEGASDESQEKLTSAFEIAASLRRLLEDRENQYATLEGTCRRKELELHEVQRKLSAANNSYSEALAARDARIHELENVLMQKQAEMQEAQLEYQELQRSLDLKEASVRKLEYEMKLKSERETQRTKAFVSSLATSWTDAGSPKRSSPRLAQINESIRSVYNQARAALQADEQHDKQQQQQQAFDVWESSSRGKSSQDRQQGNNWLPVHESEESHDDDETPRPSSDEEHDLQESRILSFATAVCAAPGSLDSKSQSELKRQSETLHEEIQQLQARIMSRLRDPSPVTSSDQEQVERSFAS